MSYSIAKKLFISFSVILFFVLITGTLNIYNLIKLKRSTDEVFQSHQLLLAELSAVMSKTLVHSLKVNQFVATGNKAHLRPTDKLHNEILVHLDNIEKRSQGTDDRGMAQQIIESYDSYDVLSKELITIVTQENHDQKSIEGKQLQITSILENALLLNADRLFAAKSEKSQMLRDANIRLYNSSVRVTLFSIGIVLLCSIILSVRIGRSIVNPVRQLVSVTQAVSAGDLTVRAHVKHCPEMSLLATTFNTMADQIQGFIGNLESEVAARTSELENRTKEIAKTNEKFQREILHRMRTENALREAELKIRSLLENSPDIIINITPAGEVQYINRFPGCHDTGAFIGNNICQLLHPDYHETVGAVIKNVFETKTREMIEALHFFSSDHDTWYEVRIAPVKGGSAIDSIMVIVTDITQRKKAEEKLIQTQQILIKNAHRAGMADIATDTLHNVGNILTSVITSGELLLETVSKSSIVNLKKANELLQSNIETIEEFIVSNPKGKKLLKYYIALEPIMIAEYDTIAANTRRIMDKVRLIEEVITSQQNYAGTASLYELCQLSQIIDNVVSMQEKMLARYGIRIVKEFNPIPPVLIQKNKVVHILINLITNARDAMAEISVEKRSLSFSISSTTDAVVLKVRDTGEGITRENLEKIFNHGFTTKENGHGFGLHSCANYVREMNGSMWAESDGSGKGATFILKLPLGKKKA